MDLVTLIIVLHDCDRARFLQCVILYAHPDGLSKVKSCSISSCGRGDHQLKRACVFHMEAIQHLLICKMPRHVAVFRKRIKWLFW
jgi:hypothetical protein